ncbi:MAG TPA: triose-phosphate isomerase [Thermodesulfobacteriota bacterium]|nr:triose-phosphate isomerase [Thermodesulfobacteriota bacterium]
MNRVPLIAGNWKMYKTVPEAVATATQLKEAVKDISGRDIVIAPSFVSLYPVAQVIKGSNINLSAQDVFWEEEGAFTGQISPAMLLSVGCTYTIIGHSERRQYFGETNETVNKKTKKSIDRGLKVIVCIGETLEEREAGKTFSILEIQISEGLKGLTSSLMDNVVIAYEPVWAIGTGKTATAAQAEEAHHFIRNKLKEQFNIDLAEKTRILYGGSVKPDNIDQLMAEKDIDGVLVGGASLKVDSFSRIAKFT